MGCKTFVKVWQVLNDRANKNLVFWKSNIQKAPTMVILLLLKDTESLMLWNELVEQIFSAY